MTKGMEGCSPLEAVLLAPAFAQVVRTQASQKNMARLVEGGRRQKIWKEERYSSASRLDLRFLPSALFHSTSIIAPSLFPDSPHSLPRHSLLGKPSSVLTSPTFIPFFVLSLRFFFLASFFPFSFFHPSFFSSCILLVIIFFANEKRAPSGPQALIPRKWKLDASTAWEIYVRDLRTLIPWETLSTWWRTRALNLLNNYPSWPSGPFASHNPPVKITIVAFHWFFFLIFFKTFVRLFLHFLSHFQW